MDLLAMRRYLSPSTTSTFSSAVSANDNSNDIRPILNDQSLLLVKHLQKIFVHKMNFTKQFLENFQKGMMITEDDYNQSCLPYRDYDNCLANNQTNTLSQVKYNVGSSIQLESDLKSMCSVSNAHMSSNKNGQTLS